MKCIESEKQSTNVIDDDIAEKLLLYKASEHDHLRSTDNDGSVTTENSKHKLYSNGKSSKLYAHMREREIQRQSFCLRGWGRVPAKSEEEARNQ